MAAIDHDGSSSSHAYAEGRSTGTSVSIHAGFPNPAAERNGAPLSLDTLLIRHPSSTYFFRIRGHNWFRYGVFDGDLAVIDRAITPRERDLVVWWQDSGDFMLRPFERTERTNIWGTITSIIHQYKAEE
jgi:SOS-response transcriptional repressor LexA